MSEHIGADDYISVSVYPCDGDENPYGEWVVQAVVDLGVVSDGG